MRWILDLLIEIAFWSVGEVQSKSMLDRAFDYTICDDDITLNLARQYLQGVDFDREILNSELEAVEKIQYVLTHIKSIKCTFEDQPINFTFNTQMEGVSLPKYILDKYPKEISIILQYEFRIVEVSKNSFTIIVYFDGKKEELAIPFASLTHFWVGRDETLIKIFP